MLYLEIGNQFAAENALGVWIRAELEPAPGWNKWWWEIKVWEKDNHEGKTFWSWAHYWRNDGSAFGLGRAVAKAHTALWRTEEEIYELNEAIKKELANDKIDPK